METTENPKNPFIMIEKIYPNLSKTHQLIADIYIHKRDIAIMLSIRELSEMAGVSPVTIISFARKLGYSGYSKMKKDMQKYYHKKKHPVLIKTDPFDKDSDPDSRLYDTFKETIKDEIELITNTLQNLDSVSLTLAINELCKSKTVYLVAYGVVLPVAEIFQHRLISMNFRVHIITFDNLSLTPTILSGTEENDLFIIFSFPYYLSTVKVVAECAKLRKNRVICITDNMASPCVPFADILLLCNAYSKHFNNSMTAVVALINVLSSMLLLRLNRVVDENSEVFSLFTQDGLNISYTNPDLGSR